MKFFNSQNCQRNRIDTVWLNIGDRSCSSYQFFTVDKKTGNPIEVTLKEFVKAKNRKVNYSYAGGFHECNYDSYFLKIKGMQYTNYIFELNKIEINHDIFGQFQIFDYANAAFKDASPVDSIVLSVRDNDYSLIDISFTSLKDSKELPYLVVESSRNNPKPYLYLGPRSTKQMSPTVAINMQSRTNMDEVPSYAKPTTSRNDEIGKKDIAAWFIQFEEEWITLVVAYDDAQSGAFSFNPKERPSKYSAYISYSDEEWTAYNKTLDSYLNSI